MKKAVEPQQQGSSLIEVTPTPKRPPQKIMTPVLNLSSRNLIFVCGTSTLAVDANYVDEVIENQKSTISRSKELRSKGALERNGEFIEIIDVFSEMEKPWKLPYEERNQYLIVLKTQPQTAIPCQAVREIVELKAEAFFKIGTHVYGSPIFQYIGRHKEENILVINTNILEAA